MLGLHLIQESHDFQIAFASRRTLLDPSPYRFRKLQSNIVSNVISLLGTYDLPTDPAMRTLTPDSLASTSAIPGCSSSVVVKSKADMAGWLKLEYMAPRDLLTSTGVGHAPYNGSLYRECH
jgi:hypothetical protein